MKKGSIIVISGPSGVGKGTVVKSVMQRYPNLRFSVSATTRASRPGEIDGVNYFFVSRERFEEMIRRNELLEYAQYVGNYYGTPEKSVDDFLSQGFDVLLEIDVQGALQIRQRRPDAVLIFITAPTEQELKRRLLERGDTPPEAMKERLAKAGWECAAAERYDYVVVNDTVARATEEILHILENNKEKPAAKAAE